MEAIYLETSRDEGGAIDSSRILSFLTLPEFRVLVIVSSNRDLGDKNHLVNTHGLVPCLTKQRPVDDERGNVLENSAKDNCAGTHRGEVADRYRHGLRLMGMCS